MLPHLGAKKKEYKIGKRKLLRKKLMEVQNRNFEKNRTKAT